MELTHKEKIDALARIVGLLSIILANNKLGKVSSVVFCSIMTDASQLAYGKDFKTTSEFIKEIDDAKYEMENNKDKIVTKMLNNIFNSETVDLETLKKQAGIK